MLTHFFLLLPAGRFTPSSCRYSSRRY